MFMAAVSWAYDVEIDGIYYNLNETNKTAEVTSGDVKYSGNINLPSIVRVSGQEYQVTSIGGYAFDDCSNLTSIVIPSSITSIGERAFINCKNLTSVTIPPSIKIINWYTFYGCRSLKSVVVPSSVETIGIAAFEQTGLTSITIPSSVTSIGVNAFWGCGDIQTMINLSKVPQLDGFRIFYGKENGKLFVPKESISLYEGTEEWRDFANILPIGGEEYYASFDNALYVENKSVRTNHEATLSLKMKNNVPITGFQCDVVMPEGVSIAMEDDEFYMIDLSTERTTAQKTNTFDSALQPDGSVRVLCGSTKNYTFSGNDGEVATIKINVADDVKDGEYFVLLKNIVMSDATGKTYKADYVASILTAKEYDLGDANNDFEVNIGDYTTIANHILGNDGPVFVEKAADVNCDNEINVGDLTAVANLILYGSSSGQNAKSIMHKASTDPAGYDNLIYIASESMKAGETKDFSVQMKNSVPMTGFQFDIEMPEGITVDMDDDFYCISLSTERTTARKTNTFDSALQPDGTVRVLCGSTKSYTFDGNDGEVAIISVKAADDVKPGNYTMKLKNIVMSDATGKTYKVDCSDVAITVTGTTGITSVSGNEVMNDGKYIINNRLVIKRGDRMYNALGELVK